METYETPLDPPLNSFLGVNCWSLSGMWLSTLIGRQFLRCVLMCQSSDNLATRKAAEFLGHHANKACSRCLKSFPKVRDNSGFDRHTWPKRTIHRQNGLASHTNADQKRIESENGARFCILFELPSMMQSHLLSLTWCTPWYC